jgi:hypothetical protein
MNFCLSALVLLSLVKALVFLQLMPRGKSLGIPKAAIVRDLVFKSWFYHYWSLLL